MNTIVNEPVMANGIATEEITKPTEQMLDEWEKKYGELTCFMVDDYEFWFRSPARMIIEASSSFLFDKNIVGYNDFIINNTVLNGKQLIENEPKVRYALHRIVDQIITDKVAKVKKRSKRRP